MNENTFICAKSKEKNITKLNLNEQFKTIMNFFLLLRILVDGELASTKKNDQNSREKIH